MADAVAVLEETQAPVQPLRAHIVSLARTFEKVPLPVWIHDFADRCLYINESARRLDGQNLTATRHVIYDAENSPLGRLTIAD
jgi:hypothetical protein